LYEIGTSEPLGSVIDVACGRGQFTFLLHETGSATSSHGIDWDGDKIASAERASLGLFNATFERGDVRETILPAADTVLLIDVLHYLTASEQISLITRAARAARARVLIRDVDPNRGVSSAVTRGIERITTTLGYNRGERVAPQSMATLSAQLRDEGLHVTSELCSARGMSNTLLVATRTSLRKDAALTRAE
jgi:SAM-dependent methyltransferase